MCGISGAFLYKNKQKPFIAKTIVKTLSDGMKRRGPDNQNIWISEDNSVALGHNRLSIIDLNKRSNQPMVSEYKDYIITFNGEIYNFNELKKYLHEHKIKFKTKSDTEVILKLYQLEGVDMLKRLRGMFAFAIWDKKKEILFLARDPYGIKPLYISENEQGFVFSSQVKPILKSGFVSKDIDYDGLLSFFLFGNVMEPNTCFKNIINLKSGNYCIISKKKGIKFFEYSNIINYFSDFQNSTNISKTIVNDLRTSVTDTINKHTTSDVPIAVMLSGGIDSSSLISHLVDLKKEFTAITIVFDEYSNSNIDELPFAKEILKGKNINHYVRKISKKEFLNDIDDIIEAMDQPSIDGINTWYACKAASEKNIKVLLSGVGGDELFFGYPSFKQIPRLLTFTNLVKKIPFGDFFLKCFGRVLYMKTKNEKWKYFDTFCSNIYSSFWLKRGIFTPAEICNNFHSFKNFKKTDDVLIITNLINKKIGQVSKNKVLAVAQLENFFYLRNQLLRDCDWASMYHSVELRTPFVDFFLLNDLKYYISYLSNFSDKTPLAESSITKIPKSILKRKKTGFNIPVTKWIDESLNGNELHKGRKSNYYNLVNYITKNIYKNSNISLIQ